MALEVVIAAAIIMMVLGVRAEHSSSVHRSTLLDEDGGRIGMIRVHLR